MQMNIRWGHKQSNICRDLKHGDVSVHHPPGTLICWSARSPEPQCPAFDLGFSVEALLVKILRTWLNSVFSPLSLLGKFQPGNPMIGLSGNQGFHQCDSTYWHNKDIHITLEIPRVLKFFTGNQGHGTS